MEQSVSIVMAETPAGKIIWQPSEDVAKHLQSMVDFLKGAGNSHENAIEATIAPYRSQLEQIALLLGALGCMAPPLKFEMGRLLCTTMSDAGRIFSERTKP